MKTTFWSFALIQAVFLYNLSPHSSLNNATPFYLRFGFQENYERLVPFGSKIQIYVPKPKRNKLDFPSTDSIMLGYVENTTEFIVLKLDNGKVEHAPSTSTKRQNNFPGVDDEVLGKALTYFNGIPVQKEDLIKIDPVQGRSYSGYAMGAW